MSIEIENPPCVMNSNADDDLFSALVTDMYTFIKERLPGVSSARGGGGGLTSSDSLEVIGTSEKIIATLKHHTSHTYLRGLVNVFLAQDSLLESPALFFQASSSAFNSPTSEELRTPSPHRRHKYTQNTDNNNNDSVNKTNNDCFVFSSVGEDADGTADQSHRNWNLILFEYILMSHAFHTASGRVKREQQQQQQQHSSSAPDDSAAKTESAPNVPNDTIEVMNTKFDEAIEAIKKDFLFSSLVGQEADSDGYGAVMLPSVLRLFLFSSGASSVDHVDTLISDAINHLRRTHSQLLRSNEEDEEEEEREGRNTSSSNTSRALAVELKQFLFERLKLSTAYHSNVRRRKKIGTVSPLSMNSSISRTPLVLGVVRTYRRNNNNNTNSNHEKLTLRVIPAAEFVSHVNKAGSDAGGGLSDFEQRCINFNILFYELSGSPTHRGNDKDNSNNTSTTANNNNNNSNNSGDGTHAHYSVKQGKKHYADLYSDDTIQLYERIVHTCHFFYICANEGRVKENALHVSKALMAKHSQKNSGSNANLLYNMSLAEAVAPTVLFSFFFSLHNTSSSPSSASRRHSTSRRGSASQKVSASDVTKETPDDKEDKGKGREEEGQGKGNEARASPHQRRGSSSSGHHDRSGGEKRGRRRSAKAAAEGDDNVKEDQRKREGNDQQEKRHLNPPPVLHVSSVDGSSEKAVDSTAASGNNNNNNRSSVEGSPDAKPPSSRKRRDSANSNLLAMVSKSSPSFSDRLSGSANDDPNDEKKRARKGRRHRSSTSRESSSEPAEGVQPDKGTGDDDQHRRNDDVNSSSEVPPSEEKSPSPSGKRPHRRGSSASTSAPVIDTNEKMCDFLATEIIPIFYNVQYAKDREGRENRMHKKTTLLCKVQYISPSFFASPAESRVASEDYCYKMRKEDDASDTLNDNDNNNNNSSGNSFDYYSFSKWDALMCIVKRELFFQAAAPPTGGSTAVSSPVASPAAGTANKRVSFFLHDDVASEKEEGEGGGGGEGGTTNEAEKESAGETSPVEAAIPSSPKTKGNITSMLNSSGANSNNTSGSGGGVANKGKSILKSSDKYKKEKLIVSSSAQNVKNTATFRSLLVWTLFHDEKLDSICANGDSDGAGQQRLFITSEVFTNELVRFALAFTKEFERLFFFIFYSFEQFLLHEQLGIGSASEVKGRKTGFTSSSSSSSVGFLPVSISNALFTAEVGTNDTDNTARNEEGDKEGRKSNTSSSTGFFHEFLSTQVLPQVSQQLLLHIFGNTLLGSTNRSSSGLELLIERNERASNSNCSDNHDKADAAMETESRWNTDSWLRQLLTIITSNCIDDEQLNICSVSEDVPLPLVMYYCQTIQTTGLQVENLLLSRYENDLDADRDGDAPPVGFMHQLVRLAAKKKLVEFCRDLSKIVTSQKMMEYIDIYQEEVARSCTERDKGSSSSNSNSNGVIDKDELNSYISELVLQHFLLVERFNNCFLFPSLELATHDDGVANGNNNNNNTKNNNNRRSTYILAHSGEEFFSADLFFEERITLDYYYGTTATGATDNNDNCENLSLSASGAAAGDGDSSNVSSVAGKGKAKRSVVIHYDPFSFFNFANDSAENNNRVFNHRFSFVDSPLAGAASAASPTSSSCGRPCPRFSFISNRISSDIDSVNDMVGNVHNRSSDAVDGVNGSESLLAGNSADGGGSNSSSGHSVSIKDELAAPRARIARIEESYLFGRGLIDRVKNRLLNYSLTFYVVPFIKVLLFISAKCARHGDDDNKNKNNMGSEEQVIRDLKQRCDEVTEMLDINNKALKDLFDVVKRKIVPGEDGAGVVDYEESAMLSFDNELKTKINDLVELVAREELLFQLQQQYASAQPNAGGGSGDKANDNNNNNDSVSLLSRSLQEDLENKKELPSLFETYMNTNNNSQRYKPFVFPNNINGNSTDLLSSARLRGSESASQLESYLTSNLTTPRGSPQAVMTARKVFGVPASAIRYNDAQRGVASSRGDADDAPSRRRKPVEDRTHPLALSSERASHSGNSESPSPQSGNDSGAQLPSSTLSNMNIMGVDFAPQEEMERDEEGSDVVSNNNNNNHNNSSSDSGGNDEPTPIKILDSSAVGGNLLESSLDADGLNGQEEKDGAAAADRVMPYLSNTNETIAYRDDASRASTPHRKPEKEQDFSTPHRTELSTLSSGSTNSSKLINSPFKTFNNNNAAAVSAISSLSDRLKEKDEQIRRLQERVNDLLLEKAERRASSEAWSEETISKLNGKVVNENIELRLRVHELEEKIKNCQFQMNGWKLILDSERRKHETELAVMEDKLSGAERRYASLSRGNSPINAYQPPPALAVRLSPSPEKIDAMPNSGGQTRSSSSAGGMMAPPAADENGNDDGSNSNNNNNNGYADASADEIAELKRKLKERGCQLATMAEEKETLAALLQQSKEFLAEAETYVSATQQKLSTMQEEHEKEGEELRSRVRASEKENETLRDRIAALEDEQRAQSATASAQQQEEAQRQRAALLQRSQQHDTAIKQLNDRITTLLEERAEQQRAQEEAVQEAARVQSAFDKYRAAREGEMKASFQEREKALENLLRVEKESNVNTAAALQRKINELTAQLNEKNQRSNTITATTNTHTDTTDRGTLAVEDDGNDSVALENCLWNWRNFFSSVVSQQSVFVLQKMNTVFNALYDLQRETLMNSSEEITKIIKREDELKRNLAAVVMATAENSNNNNSGSNNKRSPSPFVEVRPDNSVNVMESSVGRAGGSPSTGRETSQPLPSDNKNNNDKVSMSKRASLPSRAKGHYNNKPLDASGEDFLGFKEEIDRYKAQLRRLEGEVNFLEESQKKDAKTINKLKHLLNLQKNLQFANKNPNTTNDNNNNNALPWRLEAATTPSSEYNNNNNNNNNVAAGQSMSPSRRLKSPSHSNTRANSNASDASPLLSPPLNESGNNSNSKLSEYESEYERIMKSLQK